MLTYPEINPIAIQLGPIAVHWYGVMYLVGFVMAWWLGVIRAKQSAGQWKSTQIGDLLFYCAIGVIVGGRLGYVLFYDFETVLRNPLALFAIWRGGMSFHGGLVGVACALWLYARNSGKKFFEITDFIAPLVPIGLGLGRLGNFINGELWGRVTTVPWGMIFPNAGPLPRHPSMLYEFLLEGVVLFTVLWLFSARVRPAPAVTGLFLVLYGCFRFFVEFFRQPDPQLGFIALGWLTMGQLLSLPLIAGGAFLIGWAYQKPPGKPE